MCWHGVRVESSLPLMGVRRIQQECVDEQHQVWQEFTNAAVACWRLWQTSCWRILSLMVKKHSWVLFSTHLVTQCSSCWTSGKRVCYDFAPPSAHTYLMISAVFIHICIIISYYMINHWHICVTGHYPETGSYTSPIVFYPTQAIKDTDSNTSGPAMSSVTVIVAAEWVSKCDTRIHPFIVSDMVKTLWQAHRFTQESWTNMDLIYTFHKLPSPENGSLWDCSWLTSFVECPNEVEWVIFKRCLSCSI